VVVSSYVSQLRLFISLPMIHFILHLLRIFSILPTQTTLLFYLHKA
jgi:hypothetical protein